MINHSSVYHVTFSRCKGIISTLKSVSEDPTDYRIRGHLDRGISKHDQWIWWLADKNPFIRSRMQSCASSLTLCLGITKLQNIRVYCNDPVSSTERAGLLTILELLNNENRRKPWSYISCGMKIRKVVEDRLDATFQHLWRMLIIERV